MKSKFYLIGALMCLSCASVAANASVDKRYIGTEFEIKNNTAYAQLVNLFAVQGNWSSPWIVKRTWVLNPGQVYRNTLMSIKKHGAFISTTSLVISRMEDTTQKFIFASSNMSSSHRIAGDIVDGSGAVFVKSKTNHCSAVDAQGYDFCKITINDLNLR